jgi:two-component system chemotaxis response regulator CheB
LNLKTEVKITKSRKIKVLLVDDSPLVLTILNRMLSSSPDIEVVGTARHGQEALELIPRLQPAVVCTDLYMPVMDGLQLTREIMARYPRPILVVSVSVDDGSSHVFNLLEAGVLDVFAKPRRGFDAAATDFAADLAQKIKILPGCGCSANLRRRPGAESQRLGQVRSRIRGPDPHPPGGEHSGADPGGRPPGMEDISQYG